jgi:hypothetical protein
MTILLGELKPASLGEVEIEETMIGYGSKSNKVWSKEAKPWRNR